MIKVALCDDAPSVLNQLRALLDQYRGERGQETACAAFSNSFDPLAEIPLPRGKSNEIKELSRNHAFQNRPGVF